MAQNKIIKRHRAWLKNRIYVVTNSLRNRLPSVPEEDREKYCAIQSKVLTSTAQFKEEFTPIPCDYWKDNVAKKHYRRFINAMKSWRELDVDENFCWTMDGKGATKDYAVPEEARKSGLSTIEFQRERIRLRTPDNRPTDSASHYALSCLRHLMVRKDLVYPAPKDPEANVETRRILIRDHCEGIASGDFDLHYGPNSRRLYHRVVMMPSEGRCNLVHHPALFEFDVRTCHPVLMLSLFTDAGERGLYAEMLASDIYTCIAEDMEIATRKQVKGDFQRVVNAGRKRLKWMLDQYVFQFYVYHFPNFARVLQERNDLASFLQYFEAKLMVQSVGNFCREKKLFWIPMHDGFLSTEEDGSVISAFARELVFKCVGFAPEITSEPLGGASAHHAAPHTPLFIP